MSAWLLSAVTAGISLFSLWLTGNKRVEGFYLGAANQVLWFALGLTTGAYGLTVMSVFYFAFYVRNAIKWHAQQRAA